MVHPRFEARMARLAALAASMPTGGSSPADVTRPAVAGALDASQVLEAIQRAYTDGSRYPWMAT